MNKKAMLAVADVIEYFGAKGKFDLGEWASDDAADDPRGFIDIINSGDLWNKCGTAGCVAGWTLAWADVKIKDTCDVSIAACRELGITEEQGDTLFMDSMWWGRSLSQVDGEYAAQRLRDLANGEIHLPEWT